LWTARRLEKGVDALGRPEGATGAWNLETASADDLHFMESRPSMEDHRGLRPAMLARPFPFARREASNAGASERVVRRGQRAGEMRARALVSLRRFDAELPKTDRPHNYQAQRRHASVSARGRAAPSRARGSAARGRALYVSPTAATPS